MIARRTFVACGSLGVLRAAVPPGNRVALGVIGCGWQGLATVKIFQNDPRVEIAAVCDVDDDHLREARDAAPRAQACREFEAVISNRGIDAVYIATPDHWHGVIACAAARAGKDIYGEKPIAHNHAEARAIVDAVRRYGRVWQTGSWQRSQAPFRFACELVRNGRIGKVTRVDIGLPAGHTDWDNIGHLTASAEPPKTLDWQRWLGPAPDAPYAPARVHKTWRWNYDYGGGSLMDWVGHHVDIAHWGLGLDSTGPIEVQGTGEYRDDTQLWNTPVSFRIAARYANGLAMHVSAGHSGTRPGTKWIGDEGWIWVDRSGIDAHPRGLLTSRVRPDEIRLPVSNSHHRQFIDCVLTRGETLTPAEVALRSATPGFLGLIALRTGRRIRWNPEREQILDDPAAARMLGRPMRSPWHL
jgi:predicted dehydrogenase